MSWLAQEEPERSFHAEAVVLFRLRKEASRWSSSLYQDRERLGNCEGHVFELGGCPFCLCPFWLSS